MKRYVFFDGSGLITGKKMGSEPKAKELKGASFIEGVADYKTQYVLDGEITLKPEFTLTESALTFNTAGSFTVSGIPVGATFSDPDGSEVINDGEVEWSVTLPGTYKVKLELFPYLTKEWTLDVTTPPA